MTLNETLHIRYTVQQSDLDLESALTVTDNGQSTNMTHNMDAEIAAMQRIFAVRFIPYTIFASVCVFVNLLSVLAMRHSRGYKTVHHVLLYNLAVCDLMGSILLWMYYNSPYLFPRFTVATMKHCLFIVLALAAPFILSLTNSILSVLMLALNQYIAICSPLFSTANVTKGKAMLAMAVSWILAILFAVLPGLLMLFMTKVNTQHCRAYAGYLSVKAIEICSYALACLIIVIVGLYARIYRIIVKYRKPSPGIRRNRVSDTKSNYKAFVTTLLLTGALVVFWLPYVTFHFISHVVDAGNLPEYMYSIKLYFIDFLPMFIFITDPVIYGIRMLEIRKGYRRLFSKLFPCCVKEPSKNVYVRCSVRFTSVPATSSM